MQETDPERSVKNGEKYDILDAIDKADFVIGKVNEAKEEGKKYFENNENVQIEMNEKTIEVSHPPLDEAEEKKVQTVQEDEGQNLEEMIQINADLDDETIQALQDLLRDR